MTSANLGSNNLPVSSCSLHNIAFPFLTTLLPLFCFYFPSPHRIYFILLSFYIHYLLLSNWKLQVTPTQQANLTGSLQGVTSLTLIFCSIKVTFFSHLICITNNYYYYYSGSNKCLHFFKHLLNWSWKSYSQLPNMSIVNRNMHLKTCKGITFKQVRKHCFHLGSFTRLREAAPESLCSRQCSMSKDSSSRPYFYYFLNYYFLKLSLLSPFSLSSTLLTCK